MLHWTDTYENLLYKVGHSVDMTSSDPGYSLKMSKIVVKLVESHFAQDTHWVGGQFLHFTRSLSSFEEKSFKYIWDTATEQEECFCSCKGGKLKQSKHITVQSKGMMLMKWMDKKPISFISTFHGDVMVAFSKRGRDLNEARHIQEYKVFMEGIDINDQSYEFE
jgi:hypothetical protein